MTEKPSASRLALKWGGILGLVLVLYSSVQYTADLTTKASLGFLPFLLIIAGLVLAMREFRTLNGEFMTFGEGMTVGTLVAAVSGLLSNLYSVFYTSVIDTGMMARLIEQTRSEMEDEGKLTDEQIDQMMDIIQTIQSPGLQIILGLLGSILVGTLLSLGIAGLLRRQKTDPFA